MKKILSAFLDSKRIVRAASVALLCLGTGFAHGSFAHWATGEVTEINPQQSTFVIRDHASRKLVAVRWNEETRLWTQPTRRNDRGLTFDSSQVTNGAPVQIMFKQHSDHQLVTRVIRLAPAEAPDNQIKDGERSPRSRAFPDTSRTK